MALTNCSACGKPVSDHAIKCPHCGADIKKDTAILKIDWPGTTSMMNYKFMMYINGNNVTNMEHRNACNEAFHIPAGATEIKVKCKDLAYFPDNFTFEAEAGKTYTMHMSWNYLFTTFKYTIIDDSGNEVISWRCKKNVIKIVCFCVIMTILGIIGLYLTHMKK